MTETSLVFEGPLGTVATPSTLVTLCPKVLGHLRHHMAALEHLERRDMVYLDQIRMQIEQTRAMMKTSPSPLYSAGKGQTQKQDQ